MPGRLIAAVDAPAPVMVGEFAAEDGSPWALVVNLSLSHSAKVGLTLQPPLEGGSVISAEDGSHLAMEAGNCLWLAAGQGALLALR